MTVGGTYRTFDIPGERWSIENESATGFGGFYSFNAKFFESSFELAFLNRNGKSEIFWGGSLLGRLPIDIGMISLFPLAGLDYGGFLFSDISIPMFSYAYGFGMDISLGDEIYLRGEFLSGSSAMPNRELQTKTIRFSLGIRFDEETPYDLF
jgi:hypothetical protein